MLGRYNESQLAILRSTIHRYRQIMKGGRFFKAATEVGYPVTTQVDAADHGRFSGEFAPLVPESLDKTWDALNATRRHPVLSGLIKAKPVMSTQHQANVVKQYGYQTMNPFVAEGKVPGTSKSKIDRLTTDIKYLAVRREITQQAMTVGILGGINGSTPMVARDGLAFETAQGLRELALKYEEFLFRGDSSIYGLEFDGIRALILAAATAGKQWHDLRGEPLTLERLVMDIARLQEERDVFATTDTILVPYKVWATLSNAAAPYGRMDIGTTGNSLYYNRNKLYIRTPQEQELVIKGAPLMDERPDIVAGEGTTPTGGETTLTPTAASGADASSKFGADDAGDYYYRIQAYYEKASATACASIGPVTVAEGDIVTLDFDGANLAAGNDKTLSGADDVADLISSAVENKLIYYKVYRTEVDGDSGTESFVFRASVNNDGADSGTLLTDTNLYLPNTGSTYALQTDMAALYEARLLGTVRIPLAPIEMTQPFAIARFSSLFMKMPTRQMVYTNVALSL